MIIEDVKKVYEMALAYIGNGRYFAFAIAALLFLYVTSKKIRPRLIYPTLFLIFIIGTPWFYHYVFNREAYWRTFWMFPMTIFIAVFCVRMVQACSTIPERIGMTVFLILILMFTGTNMYTAERTKSDGTKERILLETTNPEKVSDGVKRIADLLLTMEDTPKVVTRKKYVYELRQYSAKIKMLYGRDIDGFMIGSRKTGVRVEIHKSLETSSPNYEMILNSIDLLGYNFLITSSQYRVNEKILDKYGYCELAILDGSAVYYKEEPTGSQSNSDKEDINTEAEITDESFPALSDSEVESTPASTSESSDEEEAESAEESGSETESDHFDDSALEEYVSDELSESSHTNGLDKLQEYAPQS